MIKHFRHEFEAMIPTTAQAPASQRAVHAPAQS
jgi:hypothetical protein